MTTSTTDLGAYAEAAVSAAAAARNEPAWLVRSREDGARAFAATPMPTPALRPWKYTDLSRHTIEEFIPDATFAPVVTPGDSAGAPAGGFAGTIADALRDTSHAAAVEAALGTVVQGGESKFVAANAAQWTGGVFVHAPRSGAFESLVTVDITAAKTHEMGAIFPRILVVAEANSEVTIIVKNRSQDAPLLVSGVVEIVANEDARVRVLFDGDWGANTWEFTTVRSRLAKAADVQIASLAIGGHLLKQHIEALIEGEGANSLIRGIALGDAEQHFDFVTLQDHMGKKSTSVVEI